MTPDKPRLLVPFGSGILFGSERGNIEALTALRDEGCEVLCLVRPEPWAGSVRTALEAAGLNFRIVPYIYEWRPKHALSFLLHNSWAFPLANIQFALAAARFRPTHIYAFNSFWVLNFIVAIAFSSVPMIYRAGDTPIRHNFFFRWLWSFITKRTDHFVANSNFIRRELTASGADATRITVIYSKPPTRSLINGHSLPSEVAKRDRFNILYVGQLTPQKGVHVLLDAFREIAPRYGHAHLLVAGRISDWEGDAWARGLAQKVEGDHFLSDRVSFLGYVENTPALYRGSHVHVCPTLAEEPLANVVMEAKEAGVPSIVFRSGGLPELIENDINGLICSDKSQQSLARAIAYYLDQPQLVRIHGEAARASLLNDFEVDHFARRWRDVVDSVRAPGDTRFSPAPT